MTAYEPQGKLLDIDVDKGYYSKHNITAADTTGKYEASSPGDNYNAEMVALYSYYHDVKKESFKYLYYDEKPLTAKDIRKIYKDVMPKNK
jgi:hypothetical protein